MNDRDKATLKLLLGQCCCPDEKLPMPSVPLRPAVHGRPMGRRPPEADEGTPFIPPPGWYATGQRPRDYGFPHVPRNDAQGRPERESGPPGPPFTVAVTDGGAPVFLEEPFSVDHQARVLRIAPTSTFQSSGRFRASGEFVVFNTRVWEYALAGNGFNFDLSTETAGSTYDRRYVVRRDRVIPYSTGVETFDDVPVLLQEPTYRVRINYTANGQTQRVRALRLRARRVTYEDSLPGESVLLYSLLARVSIGGPERWEVITINNNTWAVPVNAIRGATEEQAWPFAVNQLADLPAQPAGPIEGIVFAESETFDTFAYGIIPVTPPTLTHTPLSWISPDGEVRVRGPAVLDHSSIPPGAALETPVGDFPGPASWAAFRTQEGAALLIQQGGTMTRVDLPAGTVSSVTMTEFTQGVLGNASWFGWSPVGLLSPSWPPHEAVTRDPGSVAN